MLFYQVVSADVNSKYYGLLLLPTSSPSDVVSFDLYLHCSQSPSVRISTGTPTVVGVVVNVLAPLQYTCRMMFVHGEVNRFS